MKGDEVVKMIAMSSRFAAVPFFEREASIDNLRIPDALTPGCPDRCEVMATYFLYASVKVAMIGEFGVSAFADSGTDKESSKVDHSIELPVQICFSYTRACASKEQIALFQ